MHIFKDWSIKVIKTRNHQGIIVEGQREWVATLLTWCVYDKDHMSALHIKNTSESFWDYNRIWTYDLRDTGAMLNWTMKPRWKQVKCEFNLYPLKPRKKILRLQQDLNPWPVFLCSRLNSDIDILSQCYNIYQDSEVSILFCNCRPKGYCTRKSYQNTWKELCLLFSSFSSKSYFILF